MEFETASKSSIVGPGAVARGGGGVAINLDRAAFNLA